jgi:hypothetical protein
MPAKVWMVSCPSSGERVSFHDKTLGLTAAIEVAKDGEVQLIFETDNPELTRKMVLFTSLMTKWKPGGKAEDKGWEPLIAWHVPLGEACPLGPLRELRETALMVIFNVVDPEIFSQGW